MSGNFLALAQPGVQQLSPYVPGKPVDELARELGIDPAKIVKLASNENPLGASPKALAAIREELAELTRYPDGNGFGFCWGGRITWLYSAHNPKVKAGVTWYGRLVGEKNALAPKHPVDIASDLKVPVLGLYGAKDSGIPLDSVEKMKAALAEGSRRIKAPTSLAMSRC